MLNAALQPYPGLDAAGRVGSLTGRGGRLAANELAALVGAGALAAVAVQLLSFELRIPGSAILRAALPIVFGVAMVPRRFAGSIMTVGAAATLGVLGMSGVGGWQPAAIFGLLALGPAIDVAMAGSPPQGWRLYARFALAGAMANALAFAARAGASWLALDAARPHRIGHFSVGVFASFAACGAIAGLLSAAACFRSSAKPERLALEVER